MVLTTVDSRDRAKALARGLVEARLAACVQMTPIASVYRWEGEVREAEELLLIGKVREADISKVQAFIAKHHAYDVPEIVAFQIDSAGEPYLRWLDASTAQHAPDEMDAKE